MFVIMTKSIRRLITQALFNTILCLGCIFGSALAQASASLYTVGSDVFPGIGTALGSPSGGFYDGTYFWVADFSGDLSRLTPVTNGFPKTAIDYLNTTPISTLSLSSLLVGGVAGLAGQTEFDTLTGMGFVPEARTGRGARGLMRFRIANNLATASSIATMLVWKKNGPGLQ